MNREQVVKALELFINHDYYRTELQQPFKQNGIYYSTDATAVLCIPSNLIELPYKEQAKPNIKKIMPTIFHDPVEINLDKLQEKINSHTPLIDEFEIEEHECQECYGEGEKKCDMDHIHFCNDCDGDGIIKGKNPTGKKIHDKNTLFQCFGSYFYYGQLIRLIDACRLLTGIDTKRVYKISGKDHKVILIEVGKTQILIMPSTADDKAIFLPF